MQRSALVKPDTARSLLAAVSADILAPQGNTAKLRKLQILSLGASFRIHKLIFADATVSRYLVGGL